MEEFGLNSTDRLRSVAQLNLAQDRDTLVGIVERRPGLIRSDLILLRSVLGHLLRPAAVDDEPDPRVMLPRDGPR